MSFARSILSTSNKTNENKDKKECINKDYIIKTRSELAKCNPPKDSNTPLATCKIKGLNDNIDFIIQPRTTYNI